MGSTKLKKNKQSVVLCILDGWGERHDSEDNAIAIAKTLIGIGLPNYILNPHLTHQERV